MITQQTLQDIIDKDANENVWPLINDLMHEGNRDIIEKYLEELLVSDPANFHNVRVLNMLYVLAHIRNIKSLGIILEIGNKFNTVIPITNEVLDSLGDIVIDQDLESGIRISLVNYLKDIVIRFKDNTTVLSGVAFVVDSLKPTPELKTHKDSYYAYTAEELSKTISDYEINFN